MREQSGERAGEEGAGLCDGVNSEDRSCGGKSGGRHRTRVGEQEDWAPPGGRSFPTGEVTAPVPETAGLIREQGEEKKPFSHSLVTVGSHANQSRARGTGCGRREEEEAGGRLREPGPGTTTQGRIPHEGQERESEADHHLSRQTRQQIKTAVYFKTC